MATLSLTVHGPFAYVDNYDEGTIILMAPMCPQHHGAMFSIGADTPLEGNLGAKNPRPIVYKPAIGLSKRKKRIPEDPPGPWHGDGSCLRGPIIKDYKPEEWRFWVVLPMADFYTRVNPVPVQVNDESDCSTLAVGVRLIYTTWDGDDLILAKENEEVKFTFPDTKTTGHGELEIQLAGPVRDDPDHEDASDCFVYLSEALGYQWSILFDGDGCPHPKGSHGNDCHSPVIWAVPLEGSHPSKDFLDYDVEGIRRWK